MWRTWLHDLLIEYVPERCGFAEHTNKSLVFLFVGLLYHSPALRLLELISSHAATSRTHMCVLALLDLLVTLDLKNLLALLDLLDLL